MTRLKNRSLFIPSAKQSLVDQIAVSAKFIAPLLDGLSLSVHCDEPIGSRVVRLLFARRPAAVLRRVIAVNVDADDCATGRSAPHVVSKRAEGLAPSVADFDSAPAISGIAVVGRVATATQHVLPGFIFSRPISAVVRMALHLRRRFSLLLRKTPARLRAAALHFRGYGDLFAAAVTSVAPQRLLSGVCSSAFNSDETPKSLSGNVGFATHASLLRYGFRDSITQLTLSRSAS